MGKFYNWNTFLKWTVTMTMIILAFVVMIWWYEWIGGSPIRYLTFFFIVPVFQFLATPIFTLTKTYEYLSPMLLVFGASNEKYDLHNGTTFDFMMHMRGQKPGIQWRKKLLSYFIEGILVIIDRIEKGELPETVEVRGSSYFFSETTAKRMGFEISKTSIYEKINLLFNYLDLLWTYSVSQGQLKFPNLFKIKTATISGKNLLLQKKNLEDLHKFLYKTA